MKAYTDLNQSEKLAEILPLESADMYYFTIIRDYPYSQGKIKTIAKIMDGSFSSDYDTPCWSVAALLEELNRNCWKVSLKCCGAEWDMTYDDGERYISVSSDYAIDACVEMIIKLHEQKLL